MVLKFIHFSLFQNYIININELAVGFWSCFLVNPNSLFMFTKVDPYGGSL